ncbi:MAG: hypothetical protein P8L83_06555 [Flavobacteriaceae bacterium]|nr:hypothetical protein [Flavobacteriaceae bacterium]
MSSFLKILLFIFIISYVIRRLSPLLLRWLIRDISKKASSQNTNNYNKKQTQNKTKKSDNLGEYIDYEDIE